MKTVLGIGFVFLLPRVLGALQPYYQDEAKWAMIVDPAFGRQGTIPHPPLGEAIYSLVGALIGYDHLRWLPLLFSVGNLVLVFRLGERWGGRAAGRWSAFFLALTFYSVWSSTQFDTDGAIVPFFGLLALYGYDRGRDATSSPVWRSQVPTALACGIGLLVKFVFIFVPVAIVVDAWLSDRRIGAGRFRRLAVAIAAGAAGSALLLAAIKAVYPQSSILAAFEYGERFSFFSFDRASVTHKAYELAKCFLYASPWILIIFAGGRSAMQRARPAALFVAGFLIFHVVIAGLHGRPIDRYLGGIVPYLAVWEGVAWTVGSEARSAGSFGRFLRAGLLVLAAAPALAWMSEGPPLPVYPKRDVVDAVLRFRWDALLPLRGGSGPPGFYQPLGFVVGIWLVTAALSVGAKFIRRDTVRRVGLGACLWLGCIYNLGFIEEHVIGGRYGNPSRFAEEVVKDVLDMSGVRRVVTYDDIGFYELTRAGKYAGRFYAVPEFAEANRRKFAILSDAHFLVVRFPEIDREGFYGRFLADCSTVRLWRHKMLRAELLSCSMSEGGATQRAGWAEVDLGGS